MKDSPLVTIAIPTYNRSSILTQAVNSAILQTYVNIEIIISDNGSTDSTEDLCYQLCSKCDRITYVKQNKNTGARYNFLSLIKASNAEYFMWLGDDDWIQKDYVEKCMEILQQDLTYSLVGGLPHYYYKDNIKTLEKLGNKLSLLSENRIMRVLSYYSKVMDNGIFYGVMRKNQIHTLELRNLMGSDWLFIACLAFKGKIRTLSTTSIYRRLGGTSTSYDDIARSMGISSFHAKWPMLSIAISALQDIAFRENTFKSLSKINRIFFSLIVALTIIVRKSSIPHLRLFLNKMLKLRK